MPKKNLIRKKSRGTWSESALTAAVDDVVRQGKSVKRAAKEHCIPRTTVIRHLSSYKAGKVIKKDALGRPAVLSSEQEDDLVKLIQLMEQRLFGLSIRDVRRVVFDFCERNNIPNTFNKQTKMAGRDWFTAFLGRHQNLSVRTPEATSIHRAIGFNAQKVKIFFDTLKSLLFDSTGQRLIPEVNIYNVDESGYSICHKPTKVVATKGKKNIGSLTSAEKGKTVTAVCCVSAGGIYVPPMLIFPRARLKPELMDKAPVGAIGAANPSGWINELLFEKWFDHFLQFTQAAARSHPTLLILDGHSSHTKNISVVTKARENNVIILSLPSHCTHMMQPLDVAVFKSVNTFYDQEVQTWMRHHGRGVTELQIAELFAAAYSKAATTQNALSGYLKTGINPYNPNVFSDVDFTATQLTERPLILPNDSSQCSTQVLERQAAVTGQCKIILI